MTLRAVADVLRRAPSPSAPSAQLATAAAPLMAATREAWRLVHAATVELRYYAKYESLRQHLEASHAGRAAQRAVYWVQG